MLHLQLVFTCFGGAEIDFMDKKHDAIAFAASLIFKSLIIAAKYSGRVRKRSLKRLAARAANTKDKEMLFLKDKVCQLEMQVSILHQGERLLSIWGSPDPLFIVGSIRSMRRRTREFQPTKHPWKSQFWSGKSRDQTLIGDVFGLPINWHC